MIRQTFFITFVKFRASLKCILLIVVERIKLWNRKTTFEQYYVDLMSTAYWVHQTCLVSQNRRGGGLFSCVVGLPTSYTMLKSKDWNFGSRFKFENKAFRQYA